jgi:hypothetical protein
MSDVLLTFGDSWPAGAKIKDASRAFPRLIAEQLHLDLLDLSRPATSIDHVVMAFFNFLENAYDVSNQYTALFCLTDISRSMAWRPTVAVPGRDQLWEQDATTLELQVGNRVDELSGIYFKHLHSARLELFNYYKNITLLKLLCSKYNIKDFYAHNFYDPDLEFRIVDKNNFYSATLRQALDCKPYKEVLPIQATPEEQRETYKARLTTNELIGNGGHPTVAGHQVLADKLSKWIKEDGR